MPSARRTSKAAALTMSLVAATVAGCADGGPADRPAPQGATVFVDVAIAPMTAASDGLRGGRLTGRTVVVQDGRITAVGRAGDVAIPAGAKLIAGAGRVLSPGLVDMCATDVTAHDAPLFVSQGVTTVRVAPATAAHLALRERIAAGALIGPTLILSVDVRAAATPEEAGVGGAAGAAATGVVTVRDAAEARGAVAALTAFGVASIRVSAEDRGAVGAYRAGVAAAQTAGLRVWAGRADGIPVETSLSLGVDAMEGFAGVAEAVGRLQVSVGLEPETAEIPENPAIVDVGAAEDAFWGRADPEALMRLAGYAAHYQTWQCPALTARLDSIARAATPRLAGEAAARYAPRARRDAWAQTTQNWDGARAETAVEGHQGRLAFLAALQREGAPLLIGGGAPGAPYTAAGFALHDEIAHYADAGLDPATITRIATRDAARFLGQEGRMGVIAAGARADLILTDRDPQRDLSALRNPDGVMVAGTWLDRPALRALERDVQRRARR